MVSRPNFDSKVQQDFDLFYVVFVFWPIEWMVFSVSNKIASLWSVWAMCIAVDRSAIGLNGCRRWMGFMVQFEYWFVWMQEGL